MLTRKMMGIAPLFGAALITVPTLWTSSLFAQEEEDSTEFKVSARVDTSHVNNANLEADSANAISEMQTQASLLMFGGIHGRFADFQTDYALNSRRYSEFSERDENLLLGHSSVRIGPESRRQYVELSHSSSEITIDPQLRDLPGNRDTRTVLTANAFTSMRLGSPNLVSFQINTSDFEFKDNFENEAKSVGYGTSYARQVSPIHQLGVSVSGYNLDYRYVDEQLDYRQVALFWSGDLRRSHYGFQVGTNTMERLNQTESSPLVVANWAYKFAGQSVTATASQKLSDTSHGSGATAASNHEAGVDGRVQVRDQFKLTSVDLKWRHERVCDRCSLELGVDMQEENYLQFTELSLREVDFEIGAGYRVNPSVDLQLDATLGSYTATEIQGNNDYKSSQVVLSASFPRLVRDGAATVYVGAQERNFELTQGYSSSFIGARFQYLLIDR